MSGTAGQRPGLMRGDMPRHSCTQPAVVPVERRVCAAQLAAIARSEARPCNTAGGRCASGFQPQEDGAALLYRTQSFTQAARVWLSHRRTLTGMQFAAVN